MAASATELRPIDRSSKLKASRQKLVEAMFEANEPLTFNYTHERAVEIVARLSNEWRRSWAPMPQIAVDYRKIIKKLREKKIAFVLTGMYGISSWLGRPRATQDVDLLVNGGRTYARTIEALKELYPKLEVRTRGGLSRFYAPGEKDPLIDVIYPFRLDQEATLATAVWKTDGKLKYRIPRLEAALANKYGASLTAVRSPGKRAQDMIDFFTMVRHSMDEGRKPIDLELLESFGEKVWPGGGGAEILRLVAEAKANRVPAVSLK
jgi:hypothetical protein